jgi:thioredoxin-dependent peroxiredoxin
MLEIGTPAPEFRLPDQNGRDTSLSTLLNLGPVILYFRPADFTPGCTRHACAIRDRYTLEQADRCRH